MGFFAEDSLEFLFSKVIRLYHHQMHKSLHKIGLYKGQPFILFVLKEQDGITQKELAKKVKIEPASISVIIRRMEKTGLVERRKDLEDLRISRVYLTEQSKDILEKVEEEMRSVQQKCFRGFISEEKMLLRRFLIQMSDNLSEAD